MKIVFLAFILILCLAYSMTIKINESMTLPDLSGFNGNIFTAFYLSMDSSINDTDYCNFIQDYINNKDPTIQQNNDDKIKTQTIFTNAVVDKILSDYNFLFDDNSSFYSGKKFKCCMDIVRKTLGVTNNPMNTNKAVDLLNKIINFITKIKSNL